jgi:hypothetical protein
MMDFLLVGIFLDRILTKDLNLGSDPISIFNGALIFYFGIEFILRLFFQKLRLISAKHYLLLRVSRIKIAHLILLKSLGTMINFLPLFILIPFFINSVVKNHNLFSSLAWLICIFSIMIFNTYLTSYSKLRYFKNPKTVTFAITGVALLVILEKMKILSVTSYSAVLFNSIFHYPLLVLIAFLAVFIMYKLNLNFLISHLYIENLSVDRRTKSFKESFKFLSGLGTIGGLISLDLKLMMRNKRTRMALWMPFLFIFYGLFFYPSGQYDKDVFFDDFMLMFIGTFISGFFILSYGISTFCYESRYFGFLITNKINMLTYIRAKYYFMLLMSMSAYLISIFYVYYGIQILFVNTIMFLFNIGFTAFFYIFLATFNRVKFDLNAGIYSMQGMGSNQFFAIFVLMIVVLIIYLPFALLINKYAGFIFMGALGISGIIFQNQILELLLKQFNKRKYLMAEGFRQT